MPDPDQLQGNLVSQCNSQVFNITLRPEIRVESLEGESVLVVRVPEVPPQSKSVYIKNKGLPRGAFRRIGSSDIVCTDADLAELFDDQTEYESSPMTGLTWEDIDPDAIALYRSLRANVNPSAEELQYDDRALLRSLSCVDDNTGLPNLAGLLLFGSRLALRRLRPMDRVDYIRVPGKEWGEDPDHRFTSVDMQASLLALVNRVVTAITDDLPKGFHLDADQVQAKTITLPNQALRETVVNALMHRNYRVAQPIQIIRYANRIEFINPGYSLKPDTELGTPGSRSRNPKIASVFHETNLAETKGSGIGSIRRYLNRAGLMPPTFESSREKDTFTARLLLHHLLPDSDLKWLAGFKRPVLNDDQKKALVFVREVGAIDLLAYTQLNGCEKGKAAADIKALRDEGWLEMVGQRRGAWYRPSQGLLNTYSAIVAQLRARQPTDESSPLPPPTELADSVHKELMYGAQTPDSIHKKALYGADSSDSIHNDHQDNGGVSQLPTMDIPKAIADKIQELGKRTKDPNILRDIILDLCRQNAYKLPELARIVGRNETYLLNVYLRPLLQEGRLKHFYPEMPNHPQQAYLYKEQTPTR